VLDKMKGSFLQGCEKNNLNTTVAEKVWRDWEAFASYAFNKSHSTCYAYLAFHTAYLKAHYPAEFMAAILTNNMRDIKDVTFFLEECRRLKVKVLGPDVNESEYKFTVNAKGEIRFGLGAIKGVGEGAVEVIVTERKNGNYVSVFDLCKRIDTKAANKKTLEGLVLAGALDSYGVPRSAYFLEENDGQNLLNKAVKYGNSVKEENNSLQQSLFGDDAGVEIKEPPIPKVEEWPMLLKLNREKEVTGIFISGHPLSDFRRDILSFCKKNTVGHINLQEKQVEGREMAVAGIIISAEHKTTKNGKAYGTLEIEDFDGQARLSLFGEDYLKFKHFLAPNTFVFLRGTFKKRFNGEDLEFKITPMELLQNVRDKMAKLVKLRVNAGDVNEDMIAKLEELLSKHKGKCRIQFSIYDTLDKIWVDMPSREIAVNPTNELLDELEGILSHENVEMA
ncbi:MAG: OB-fold nucleic acid binding domain-containing protein, partial [Flavobacteriales bacterium]